MDKHIPNIGDAERMKRFWFGVVCYALSLAVLAWLVHIGANRLWRIGLFFLYFLGGFGVFQMITKTCYVLARMGKRNMGWGKKDITDITDKEECVQVWKQANELIIWAGGVALLLTVFSLFIW